jgi:2-methylisocitrate lyase-like PEP mutase family enzyme
VAFEEAGADVLYAPGLRDVEEIELCATRSLDQSTCWRCQACHWPRSSARSAADQRRRKLAWVGMRAAADAAIAIRDEGDLSSLTARLPLAEWFGSADRPS